MIEKPKVFDSEEELPKGVEKKDLLKGALQELFFIEFPHLKMAPNTKEEQEKFVAESKIKGVWVYYSWHNLALHIPPEDIYFRLRTARNRNLITEEEQQHYRNTTVGIAGLSVGSAIVSALTMTGGSKFIKIADPDTIEITNLNRIKAKLTDVNANKTEIAARETWELDPFADLELWKNGVTALDLQKFIEEPRLDIFIDEMDSIEMKIKSRLICRELKIPVLMATDNGDGIVLDVERFDLDKNSPIFHGRVAEEELATLTPQKFLPMVLKIIDPTFFTDRQRESIAQIGKTLSGVAQLASAAAIAGAGIAYTVRQIASGAPLPSGRYILGCENVFTPGYDAPEEKKRRFEESKKFAAGFGVSIEEK